jgi:hypothetical protein
MSYDIIKTTLGTLVKTDGPKPNSNLPITFRLPRAGQRDPHFGLSRAWFYAAEADGRLRLIRLREKGKSRGITLVPTVEVIELLEGGIE